MDPLSDQTQQQETVLVRSDIIQQGDRLTHPNSRFFYYAQELGAIGKTTNGDGEWAGYQVTRSLPAGQAKLPLVNVPSVPPGCGDLVLKDSGSRRSFGTGSVRDVATGKGTPHLMPLRALTLAEQQMERGMTKYGARNWELGQPLSTYFDSATRHLRKHFLGWTDEPHLAAYVWNALAYAETAERIRLGILPKELDDRPSIGKATEDEMNGKASA